MKYFYFCILLFPIAGISSGKPKVLATASMWADMARVLGSERIEVDVIVPIGSDPHLYEPTPNDVFKVNNADLILINGLTFEGWLEKLIRSSGTAAMKAQITEGITPISNPHFLNSTDPHAWMDAENGKIYARNIAAALSKIDPAHEDEYQFNLKIYLQELDSLHHYMLQKIESIPAVQRVLITSHDAFHYFGNRYGLQVESLLGTSTDADVQTGDFLRVNKMIREKKIPAVFIESTINPKLMEQLVRENHIRIGGKLYADSLGDEKSPANTYIQMLKHNADVIAEALSVPLGVQDLAKEKSGNSRFAIILILAIALISSAIYYLIKKSR